MSVTALEWPTGRLGDLVLAKYGKGLSQAKRHGGSVPVYGSNGVVGYHDQAITKGPTIIIGRKGSLGAVNFSHTACWPIDTTYYIDEPGPFSLEFLDLLLRSLGLEEFDRSTAIPGLNRDELYAIEVPVPPVAMQDELVRVVTSSRQLGASAREHLSTGRRAIERFRQAVLAAACSGRLTADWRDSRGLGEWELARAEDICSKVQSGTTPKVWHNEDGGVPFLKVYNIVNQRLDFDYRPQYISPELFRGAYKRTEALAGDVLMNIVGPPLGKVAIVTDQYPAWSINQALTLFRPSERVSTEWLYIFLCSGISVNEVMNDTKGTVGQVNISLTQCRNFMIPVPTREEQTEIDRRVGELLKVANTVARRISVASGQVDRTSQAVLAKAFRGELIGAGARHE